MSITDNELDAVLLNHHDSMRDLDRMRRAPPAFVDFVRGADLLIGDAQYTDDEYPRRAGWGASTASHAGPPKPFGMLILLGWMP